MGGLKVINRTTRAVTTISLAALDVDGAPNCISAYAVGTKVFVACEILDPSYTPRGPGKIAVIDTTTDTVTAIVRPHQQQPVRPLHRHAADQHVRR